MAKINVFDEKVAQTHPKVKSAQPMVCELNEGEALFMPTGWHHAVISHTPEGRARNIAVNTWYDPAKRGGAAAASGGEAVSEMSDMFQAEGCP